MEEHFIMLFLSQIQMNGNYISMTLQTLLYLHRRMEVMKHGKHLILLQMKVISPLLRKVVMIRNISKLSQKQQIIYDYAGQMSLIAWKTVQVMTSIFTLIIKKLEILWMLKINKSIST